MSRLVSVLIIVVAMLGFSLPLRAQEGLSFESFKTSSTAPIEVNADKLELVQSDRKAVFRGNVVASQGPLTMYASALALLYDPDSKGDKGPIERVEASGRVVMMTITERAEADQMIYLVHEGLIRLTGNVTLAYSGNMLTGEALVIDLNSGMSRIEGSPAGTPSNGGRVKAIFLPGGLKSPNGAP